MRHGFHLTILLLVAFSNAAINIPKLTDVFHVDTRDPNTHFSSCRQRLDPNDPDSALFDPNEPIVEENDSTHKLNMVWYWIHYLVPNVRAGIDSIGYEQSFDTRKLLDAFFAIKPGRGPPSGKWEPDDPHDLSTQKLVRLRGKSKASRCGSARAAEIRYRTVRTGPSCHNSCAAERATQADAVCPFLHDSVTKKPA